MIGHYKSGTVQGARPANASDRLQEVQNLIDRCYSMSRRNLWELLLFLLVSICAYTFRDFNLFDSSSESLRQILGYPPPAYLVSIALAIYGFSCITLTLTAMANHVKPTQKWNHLGYRSAFFLFYCFSGAISAHFLPVLLIGLSLYGLDQCHIWTYNNRSIHREKEYIR